MSDLNNSPAPAESPTPELATVFDRPPARLGERRRRQILAGAPVGTEPDILLAWRFGYALDIGQAGEFDGAFRLWAIPPAGAVIDTFENPVFSSDRISEDEVRTARHPDDRDALAYRLAVAGSLAAARLVGRYLRNAPAEVLDWNVIVNGYAVRRLNDQVGFERETGAELPSQTTVAVLDRSDLTSPFLPPVVGIRANGQTWTT